MEKLRRNEAITLVALIVTIVVLLILAGITITYIMGENSIFKKAQDAKLQTEIAKAREKLEIVLTTVQIEKRTNRQYNENEFLDEYILNNLKDVKIIGDVAIVDGYAFEMDRSIPRIGEYIGKEEELIFPEIRTTVTTSEDYRTATIIIKAREKESGISEIQIIQDGFIIKTYKYENIKEMIEENYEVKQNGVYIIKVYSKLVGNNITEVNTIIPLIQYSPNGSQIYKKGHSTKILVADNKDKVKNVKYQWKDEIVEPTISSFILESNLGEIITKKDVTGLYYLWVLIEFDTGAQRIERSEAFYFDNEGPKVEISAMPQTENSFEITVNATDTLSEIAKYEFYINLDKRYTKTTADTYASYTFTDLEMGEKECKIIVYDALGNSTTKEVIGTTKLHTWETYTVVNQTRWRRSSGSAGSSKGWGENSSWICYQNEPELGETSGFFVPRGGININPEDWTGKIPFYVVPTNILNNTGTFTSSYYKITKMYPHLGNICSEYISYSREQYTIQVKGSLTGNVKSSEKSKYPNDGKSGSIWYVYIGIE